MLPDVAITVPKGATSTDDVSGTHKVVQSQNVRVDVVPLMSTLRPLDLFALVRPSMW